MTKKDKHSAEKENTKNTQNHETNATEKCYQEVDNLKDQLIRVNADFQNFKKRVEREKAEWMSVGQEMVLERFLPFIDDLDRAIQSCSEQEMDEQKTVWLQGFIIIEKNLKKMFSEIGVKEVDCSIPFDPEYHEALMQVDSKEHKSGQIVQVFSKGYLFKDKVLKHAKVSVAK